MQGRGEQPVILGILGRIVAICVCLVAAVVPCPGGIVAGYIDYRIEAEAISVGETLEIRKLERRSGNKRSCYSCGTNLAVCRGNDFGINALGLGQREGLVESGAAHSRLKHFAFRLENNLVGECRRVYITTVHADFACLP